MSHRDPDALLARIASLEARVQALCAAEARCLALEQQLEMVGAVSPSEHDSEAQAPVLRGLRFALHETVVFGLDRDGHYGGRVERLQRRARAARAGRHARVRAILEKPYTPEALASLFRRLLDG